MKILRIKARNFMLHRRLDIEIPDIPVVGIIGKNGVGKSTLIVDIVNFVLFGRSRPKARGFEGLSTWGHEEFSGGLTLLLQDNRTCELERCVSSGSNFGKINGEKVSISELDRFISDCQLGSYEDFAMTTCFYQDDITALIRLTPAKMLQLFSDWCGLSFIRSKAELVNKELSEVNTNITGLKADRNALVSIIGDITEEGSLSELEKLKQDCEERIHSVQKELKELSVSVSETESIRAHIASVESIRVALQDELASLVNSTKLVDLLPKKHSELVSKEKEYKESSDILSAEFTQLVKLKSTIAQLRSIVTTNLCPVILDYKCPKLEGYDATTLSELETAYTDRYAHYSSTEALLKALAVALESLRIDVSLGQAAIKGGLKEKLNKLSAELQSKLKEKEALQNRLAIVSSVKKEGRIHSLREVGGQLDNQRDDFVRRITLMRDSMIRRTEASVKITSLDSGLKTLGSRRDLLGFSYHVLFRSLPTRYLSHALSELELIANAILEFLRPGVSVEFVYIKELKGLETSCPICGRALSGSEGSPCEGCGHRRTKKTSTDFSLYVRESNRRIAFPFLSGGYKALVGLAVRLASSYVLRTDRSIVGSLAVFDEVAGMLDKDHRSDFVSFLYNKASEFGITQSFVITHQQDIRSALPKSIIIERYGNESITKVI